jgi:transposase-like protein
MGKKVRVFSAEQKLSVVKRMLSGERTTELARELKIKRTHLYKWKDIYRRFGADGFSRRRGRPSVSAPKAAPASELAAAKRQIAELERKIGQQEMDLDFFRQALRQVGADRQANSVPGAKRSTPSSKR